MLAEHTALTNLDVLAAPTERVNLFETAGSWFC
jgi:hypothetical protein